MASGDQDEEVASSDNECVYVGQMASGIAAEVITSVVSAHESKKTTADGIILATAPAPVAADSASYLVPPTPIAGAGAVVVRVGGGAGLPRDDDQRDVTAAKGVRNRKLKGAASSRARTRKIRTLPAWDKLRSRSFDVFLCRKALDKAARSVKTQHWGPNCATFSRALEIPIPGARWFPKPCRSIDHPEGLPGLEQDDGLPAAKRQRIKDDTAMANMAGSHCGEAVDRGDWASLEHPRGSYAWHLEKWQAFCSKPGVQKIDHDHCMFHPCRKRKRETIATNIPGMERHIGRTCNNTDGLCDRTGEEHESFENKVESGKVVAYGTTGTAEYPIGLCEAYARGLAEAMGSEVDVFDREGPDFLEVFCGPRAPLSCAVDREKTTYRCPKPELIVIEETDSQPPSQGTESSLTPVKGVDSAYSVDDGEGMAATEEDDLLWTPFQNYTLVCDAPLYPVEPRTVRSETDFEAAASEACAALVKPCQSDQEAGPIRARGSDNVKVVRAGQCTDHKTRLGMLAASAGHQPKLGRVPQLIPDGINDMEAHLAKAKTVDHPGYDDDAVIDDHLTAVDNLRKRGRRIVWDRINVVHAVEEMENDYAEATKRTRANASFNSKQVLPNLNIPVMEVCGKRTGIEDPGVPASCGLGLPIVGKTPKSAFFMDKEEPAEMTIMELMTSAPQRRSKILQAMAQAGLGKDPAATRAALRKTEEEVAAGTMGKAMSPDEARSKHGPHYNVCRRFGLKQGTKDDGTPRYRAIDDHSENDNNEAAHREQRILLMLVNYILLLVRVMVIAFPVSEWPDADGNPKGATEDFTGAYRQCPLAASQVFLALTAVFNDLLGVVQLHEMLGQPFGAAHAVHNFNRLAEWISRVVRRMLRMVLDHYFDDFIAVEPAFALSSGMWAFRRIVSIFGFRLDPAKQQLPTDAMVALGVLFSMTMVRTVLRVPVKPKPTRCWSMIEELLEIIDNKALLPAHAGRIVGKLQFLADTMYGKMGRAGLKVFRDRQYQGAPPFHVHAEMLTWLRWWVQELDCVTPRELPVYPDAVRPTLLYTDGAEFFKKDGEVRRALETPDGFPKQRTICGVVDSPKLDSLQYFKYTIDHAIIEKWMPRQAMINQVECSAGIVALDTWPDLFRESDVIHFLDSNTSLGSLIKGSSPIGETSQLVGAYWARINRLKTYAWLDRVESKSNIADGPTKFNDALLLELGAKEVQPVVDGLVNCVVHPKPGI